MTNGKWRQIPYVGGVLGGWRLWTDVSRPGVVYTYATDKDGRFARKQPYRIEPCVDEETRSPSWRAIAERSLSYEAWYCTNPKENP